MVVATSAGSAGALREGVERLVGFVLKLARDVECVAAVKKEGARKVGIVGEGEAFSIFTAGTKEMGCVMRRPERECCCGVKVSLSEVLFPAPSSSSSFVRFRLPPRLVLREYRWTPRETLGPRLPRGRPPPRPRLRGAVICDRMPERDGVAVGNGKVVVESPWLVLGRVLTSRPCSLGRPLKEPRIGPRAETSSKISIVGAGSGMLPSVGASGA